MTGDENGLGIRDGTIVVGMGGGGGWGGGWCVWCVSVNGCVFLNFNLLSCTLA